ncbi:MAG: hypothetical protein WAV95_10775 [Azonexus sp.]
MAKLVFAVLGSLVAVSAFAQDGAVKMSREELLSFLPGTKVTHISQAGSERHWTNEPDGSLYANSTNKLYGSALGTQTTGQAGTWNVSDDGKYCIDIDWKRVSEKWCAAILKGEGDIYYLGKVGEKSRIIFAR